ncbi:3Fe-4S ferredoxin [Xanthomonas axonopodis]|uniref:Ferredoxin n=1 Tax=Xanthomonas axonopodis TaxID=53413 RepID=A0A0P6VDH7_9XANT|nr:ferredoxin [Xanthomonas axonopodis]KPL48136.1 3Fe-4S ferredoxin [Xanthomonas axonopodis]
MRVVVDQALCATTGQCALTLPGVFRQREPDGVAEVCVAEIPPSLHAAARLAASQCPVAAIRIIEAEAAHTTAVPASSQAERSIASAPRSSGGHDGKV